MPCCSSLGPHRVSSSPQGHHLSLLLRALGAKSALKDTLGDSQGLHFERPGLQKRPQGPHFEGLGPQKGPQGHPNGSIWSSLEPCRAIFEPTTAQTNGNPHHQQKPAEPAAPLQEKRTNGTSSARKNSRSHYQQQKPSEISRTSIQKQQVSISKCNQH